jgi:hypothetical protein
MSLLFIWLRARDRKPNVTITSNTTITELSEGTHDLIIYIEDTLGNIATSKIIHFTVDITSPNIIDVHQLSFENNTTIEGTRVNATVIDAVSGVKCVALNYTNSNGTWILSQMTNLEGDNWSGIIPAFPHGTKIKYKIIAEDIVGHKTTTEEILGYLYQYEVFPEFSSWTILPLFLISTLSIILIKKKLIKN